MEWHTGWAGVVESLCFAIGDVAMDRQDAAKGEVATERVLGFSVSCSRVGDVVIDWHLGDTGAEL